MKRQRVKVCCIRTVSEAVRAVQWGADALGLVSAMPSGPGVIDDDTVAEIADWAPPGVSTFLVTALQDGAAVLAQHARCRTSAIQFCDDMTRDDLEAIRSGLPGIKLVQTFHVIGGAAQKILARIDELDDLIDAVILGSGAFDNEKRQLGGTGRVHDWSVSRRIVEETNKPVWLAGGLRPDNVIDARRTVRPFGVDVCSGVRVDGQLDAFLLRDFIRAVETRRS